MVVQVGGISPFSSTSAALINPATPAAASRWPKFDLTAPSAHGLEPPPITCASASTSIGSPSAVPVPCVSTYPMSAGIDPRIRECGANHLLLRQPVRRGQARGSAILPGRAAADDGANAVPCRQSVGKPLEHDHAAAFARHKAVRGGIESVAAPVGRQHRELRQAQIVLGCELQADAAGDGGVAIPRPQTLHRQVDRHQRRRARRIDRDGRSAQIEQKREPARRHALGRPGAGIRADCGFVTEQEAVVVGVVDRDENAGRCARHVPGPRPLS